MENKVKIFIIHGAYGSPEENWFPWLKRELEKFGQEVYVPKFPTPEKQSLENWMKAFDKFIDKIDKNTVFVGHSLGPAFILSILEKLKINEPIKACFFVCGFIGPIENKEINELNKTFTIKKFSWEKIKRNCRNFYLYNSDNDPYVALEKGKELAFLINGKLKIIHNAGHINQAAGYAKFELLLEDIMKSLT